MHDIQIDPQSSLESGEQEIKSSSSEESWSEYNMHERKKQQTSRKHPKPQSIDIVRANQVQPCKVCVGNSESKVE